MFAWGMRRDLFACRRWSALFGETVGRNGLRAGGRQLVKAAAGALAAPLALRLSDRAWRRSAPAPRWMGPRLRAHYPPGPEQLDTLGRAWPSHLACELWARATSPHVSACIDSPIQGGANDGLEVRMPYADVRFIETVLRIPSEQRVERRDVWALRQDALGTLMPAEFRTRPPQASWQPTFGHAARCSFGAVAALLAEGTWLIAPYFDEAETRRWLAELMRKGEAAPDRDCIIVAEIGAVEAWLRLLLRYDAAREVAV